eukprot:8754232-Ditylum_brightwellii.AAC.1
MGNIMRAEYGEFNSTLMQLMSSKLRKIIVLGVHRQGLRHNQSQEEKLCGMQSLHGMRLKKTECIIGNNSKDDDECFGEDITKYLTKKTNEE